MDTVGIRYNQGKPQLSLVLEARHGMAGIASVLEYGLLKYNRGNWRKGLSHTSIADSLIRHITAYLSGEDIDNESGLYHIDHIAANGLFLAEMWRTRPDLDDREVVK